MSLQAELIRLGARAFIRGGTSPEIPIAVQRQRMREYERRVPRAAPDTRTSEEPLGGIPAIRIDRPEARPGRHILFLHGGGYSTGSAALYRHITWRFVAAAGARLAAIDYRLAPEHPFPAALDDALAAWRGLLDEGAQPAHCVVMGDSAGGGLTLALAMRLRDAGAPLPAALVAISPWTDLAITGHSSRPGARDPMLHARDLASLAGRYLGGADPRNPYVSPLYGEAKGLPPTLLQVGSDEILRDDSVRMAKHMQEAGCDVTLEIWPRMPHVWHAFAPMMPEARKAIGHVGAFVQRCTA